MHTFNRSIALNTNTKHFISLSFKLNDFFPYLYAKGTAFILYSKTIEQKVLLKNLIHSELWEYRR